MKAKELIKIMKRFPKNAEVIVSQNDDTAPIAEVTAQLSESNTWTVILHSSRSFKEKLKNWKEE